MNQVKCILAAISLHGLAAVADESQEFDFKKVVEIAAIKGDKYALFANPDILRPISDIVANSVSRLDPGINIPQDKNIELFFVGVDGTSTRVTIGDHWISDGKGVISLSNNELSTIMGPINGRTFDNDVSTLNDLKRDVNLEEYRVGNGSQQINSTAEQRNNHDSGGSETEPQTYSPSVGANGSTQNRETQAPNKTISSTRSFSSNRSSMGAQLSRQISPSLGLGSNVEVTEANSMHKPHTVASTDHEINTFTLGGISTVIAVALLAFLWRRKR